MRTLISVFILLLSGCIHQVLAQITLSLKDVPVTVAIEEFSSVSGYRFAYNPDILASNTLTASVKEAPLEKAVDIVFANHYDYKIRGSYVILLPKSQTASQNRGPSLTISGEVLDAGTNKKLEGVSVYEVHTLKPVLTNATGDYKLDVSLPEELAFIAISKENYQDTVIQVHKNEKWTVALRQKLFQEEDTTKVKDKVFAFFNGKQLDKHAKNINLTERRWMHLALTPGLSTNGFLSGQFTNKFSVNMIAGYSYALEGVELGGFLNMERSYVEGVQLSGFGNINGDYTDGIQMAGFSNITLGPVKGVQLGGFSNHSEYMNGLQMSGAINTARGGKGSQWAGMMNTSNGLYKGWQVSGGLNYAKVLQGVQFGVVNVADSVSSGFMVGVVNWTKNGLHHFEVGTSDITPYTISFKSGVFPFYTILKAGINPHEGQLWDYGMGFGSFHSIRKKASIDFESTYHEIQSLDKGYIEGNSSEIRFQIRFGYRLANHLQLLGGPVLHYFWFHPDNPDDLAFADRFGKNAFAESNDGNRISKAWLGYEMSVRF
ncbi:hypothetical protein [Marinoscillum sp.]|uniref:hypothetical protein n=1 Tax=Marinoscillum sp. TaxID=2024838 RepID=UPI003BAAA387